MPTYNLNFSLTTETERCAAVTEICSLTTYTEKQYTQLADYILLANRENNIYPEQFNSPKTIHDIQSLDELMENPIFDDVVEATIQPIQRTIYKKTTRKIDRSNPIYSSIPNMRELWEIIDYYKQKLQQNPNDWQCKHLLISLYKQQYSLLETTIPDYTSLPQPKTNKEYLSWHMGIPLQNGDYADLDLCNPTHMTKFLIYMPLLQEYCTDMGSELYQLLQDTTQAINIAPLTPIQRDILFLYQCGKTSKEMIQFIWNKYNRKLTQSYTCVIFTKQVAVKVAEEYAEIYNSRIYKNNPAKWRICLSCKQKKLLTKHNFHRFSNKPQGFSLICKECANAAKAMVNTNNNNNNK